MATANTEHPVVHEHAHDEEHHHGNFITTYIFSTDHKMIAKQYLLSGILWAFVGGLLSIMFHYKLSFEDSH